MSRPVTRRERVWITISLILAVVVLFGGRGLPNVAAREKGSSELFEDLKIFTDVLAIVQRDYVREVGSKELVEGAIKGMLTTLDPHSGYLDPTFYQDLQVQTKGEFGGLGIEIAVRDERLVVVAPMDGSPAQKAGIRAGDEILKIEGKFTKQFTLIDAVKQLRGPKGSSVAITIRREGVTEPIDVTVVRDIITVHSVRHRYLGDGFGYVRINQFMEKTGEDVRKALRSLSSANRKKGGIKGIVLDLRNNPGGLLTQAVRVSDMFLKEGVIVYTDGRVEAQKQKFFANERGTEPDYPIVVLVNGGSASASEIVAGALQDHGRALVLGTQTFGKGSVQTITPLENGGALTITTALYYTKSGNSIQLTGVRPDVTVELQTLDGDDAEKKRRRFIYREGDLPGAIDNPNGRSSDPQGDTGKTSTVDDDISSMDLEKIDLDKWLASDAQLEQALHLLKTFNIFGTGLSVK